jgi:hypothetical protein
VAGAISVWNKNLSLEETLGILRKNKYVIQLPSEWALCIINLQCVKNIDIINQDIFRTPDNVFSICKCHLIWTAKSLAVYFCNGGYMRFFTVLFLAILPAVLSPNNAECQTLMGWQLNESNTGLAGVGIDRDTLPLCSLQPDEYGWLWPDSGTVIRDKRIENPVCLAAGGITIERCWFKLTVDPGNGMSMITDFDFNRMKSCTAANTIRDCDIDGTFLADTDNTRSGFPTVGSVGNWQRNNIYGVGCGWYAGGNNVPILVENNYVHDLRTGTTSHDDGMTVRSRSSPCSIFRNNRINAATIHTTGAFFLQATFGFLDSIYVEGNFLEGNGYNLILEWNGNGYGRIWASNNRFRFNQYGTGYVDGGGGWLGWQDMYLNDSTQPDNKGAVVSEPRPATDTSLRTPGDLQAILQSSGHVRLTWNDSSTLEKGFRIERSAGSGTSIGIDMKDSNTSVYYDTGLSAGSYTYRVASYGKAGMSGYSNEAQVIVTTSVSSLQNSRTMFMPARVRSIISISSRMEFDALSNRTDIELYTVNGTRLNGSRAVSSGVFLICEKASVTVKK